MEAVTLMSTRMEVILKKKIAMMKGVKDMKSITDKMSI